MKLTVNLKRRPFVGKFSAKPKNFAAIKNYYLYHNKVGVLLNLPSVLYLTPYFTQGVEWNFWEDDQERFAPLDDYSQAFEYRVKRVINSQLHFISVNGWGEFPLKICLGSLGFGPGLYSLYPNAIGSACIQDFWGRIVLFFIFSKSYF